MFLVITILVALALAVFWLLFKGAFHYAYHKQKWKGIFKMLLAIMVNKIAGMFIKS